MDPYPPVALDDYPHLRELPSPSQDALGEDFKKTCGTRPPDGIMWAASADDFYHWALDSVWSRSMIEETGRHVDGLSWSAPEAKPHLILPWSILRRSQNEVEVTQNTMPPAEKDGGSVDTVDSTCSSDPGGVFAGCDSMVVDVPPSQGLYLFLCSPPIS
jgi:hypothetical protein